MSMMDNKNAQEQDRYSQGDAPAEIKKSLEEERISKVRELFARMTQVRQYPYTPDDDPEDLTRV